MEYIQSYSSCNDADYNDAEKALWQMYEELGADDYQLKKMLLPEGGTKYFVDAAKKFIQTNRTEHARRLADICDGLGGFHPFHGRLIRENLLGEEPLMDDEPAILKTGEEVPPSER